MILVTSCPECKTTFRISVGILEKAGGQVRCGRCARIFDANAKLREVDESEVESKPSPAFKFELQPDPELDSPAEPSADAPPAVSRDATEESGGEPGERDDTSPDDEISAPDAELAAPDDGIAAPDNQLSAPDDELSAPDDDIPASDDEHAEPVGEPTDAKLAAAESRELATEAEAVLPDRDDASSASDDELAMSDAEVEAEAEAEAKTEAEADAAVEAEAKAEADADTEAAPEAEHEHIVLETSPATRQPRSADEPSVAAERSEVPAWLLAQSEPRPARTRLWAAGVALATLALVGQLVHQYREELIAVPAIGPMLSLAYAGFGTELRPRVDLDQYELRDLTAVAEPSGEDQGWLVIETRVHNSGPDVQPYPHIFVRLLDRWEDTVAARYFAPDEYAVSSIADIDRMSVGNTIDAQFIIMDPGPSATGFELELCIELTRGFQCESDVDDE